MAKSYTRMHQIFLLEVGNTIWILIALVYKQECQLFSVYKCTSFSNYIAWKWQPEKCLQMSPIFHQIKKIGACNSKSCKIHINSTCYTFYLLWSTLFHTRWEFVPVFERHWVVFVSSVDKILAILPCDLTHNVLNQSIHMTKSVTMIPTHFTELSHMQQCELPFSSWCQIWTLLDFPLSIY